MIRENGINPEKEGDRFTCLNLLQKGNDFELRIDFKPTTGRQIEGRAHFEKVDKENELILLEAIGDSLPQFMKHPILHVQHTERPVGTVTKSVINLEDRAIDLVASIFETEDTDDVWHEIKSGSLNKFSIYGKRLKGSPECSIPPSARTSPCITKALVLYSISVVGDNAINDGTYLTPVTKAGGDHTPVGKYETMGSCMAANSDKDSPGGYCASIEHRATGKWPAEKGEPVENEDEKEEMEKSSEEVENPILKDERNPSQILERLSKVESVLQQLVDSDKQVHAEMGKAESEDEDEMDDKKEDKKEEVEKCSDGKMKKAEETPVDTKPAEEFITKAFFDDTIKKALLDIDDIKKGYADLKSRVDKMEKETIEKGAPVVVVVDKGKVIKSENPNMDNLDMIGSVV